MTMTGKSDDSVDNPNQDDDDRRNDSEEAIPPGHLHDIPGKIDESCQTRKHRASRK